MRLFVGRVLQDAGHEVAMAASGDEAIAMLPALTSLDVLVTDEVMPRLPGHELARLVRAREPAVRVFVRDRLQRRALQGEAQALGG